MNDIDHLDVLRRRLVSRAADEHLLDITYTTVDSPFGRLLLAATDIGVVRVGFATDDHDELLSALSLSIGPRVLESRVQLDAYARQLDDYFSGDRTTLTVPVDLRLATGFRRDVLDQLALIPYGTTMSYGAVAASTGRGGASRAVGTACAKNPVPLFVPCHRVVRSDGSAGQYAGGPEVKKRLLELEGARDPS